MSRIIKRTFWLCDFIAWIIVGLILIALISSPFTAQLIAEVEARPVNWYVFSIEAFLNAMLLLGFWLYIRRSIVSFVFISISFIGMSVFTQSFTSIIVLVPVLGLFGLPWYFGLREMERVADET